jgi:hypothetical protein
MSNQIVKNGPPAWLRASRDTGATESSPRIEATREPDCDSVDLKTEGDGRHTLPCPTSLGGRYVESP